MIAESGSQGLVKSARYRPEIDGLRALAVLPVILYHAGNSLFTGGYVGVDVFFVISGFLITSIIDREFAENRFTFRTFYERRIRRIFPALYFVLAVVLLIGMVALTPQELRNLGQSIVGTVAFAANLFFYLKSGYFDAGAETHPLLHMWSLGVEEQFYIFFPIALLIAWRWMPKLRIPAVILAMLVSLGFAVAKIDTHATDVFFLPHFRAWELLVGCLIAMTLKPVAIDAVFSKWMTGAIEVFAVLCILGPMLGYHSATTFPGLAAVPPVLGTALLIIFSRPDSMVGRLLSLRPLVLVGLISYSAYLWHQPLLVVARLRSGSELEPTLAYSLAVLALFMAYLSWRYVERPFRDRSFLTQNQIFALAGVSTAALAGIGLMLHITNGLPQRFPANDHALAKTAQLSPMRTLCHAEPTNPKSGDTACRYFGDDVTWAIFGDSHGVEIGYALAEALKPAGKGLVHLTYSGCAPVLREKVDNPGCTDFLKDSAQWLRDNSEIEDIVVAFRHPQYLSGPIHPLIGARGEFHPAFLRDLPREAVEKAYWEDYRQLVSQLADSGKRVHLLITSPELPRSPYDFAYTGRWPFLPSSQSASVPLSFVDKRQGYVREQIKRIAATSPNIFAIDPNNALCDDTQCKVVTNGNLLYFDDNHLSLPGARLVVPEILKASGVNSTRGTP